MGSAVQLSRVPAIIIKRIVFVAAWVVCMMPWAWGGPPLALAVGMVFALTNLSQFQGEAKKVSRVMIQACVVLLGLRVDLGQLAREASHGFAFAAATIVVAFAIGFALQALLRTGKELTLLVSSGTAICGGSAIAAVGSAIGSSSSAMAVATGAIFVLNAVALYAFPAIGYALHLSDTQFGTWAGVAIHDISSVVGAASHYHAVEGDTAATALDTANIVKLSRVIWILPCTLFAGWIMRRERAMARGEEPRKRKPWWKVAAGVVPLFILLFLLASAVRTFVPAVAEQQERIKFIAGLGFAGALFLIGSGLSRKALASVGWRVLTQAVLLWIAVAGLALGVVVWWVR